MGTPSFSFKEWLLEQASNLSANLFATLMMLLWGLWKNRNDKLWNNLSRPASAIVAHTLGWYEEFIQANKSIDQPSSVKMKGRASWRPPLAGMLHLNIDGAFVPSLNYGGVGGVIRNEKGEFIAGFASRKSHVISALHAELLEIKHGLELIQALVLTNVIVLSDCMVATKAIGEPGEDLSQLGILVEDIKELLHELPTVGIQHTYRSANNVAHRLASHGFDFNVQEEWFTIAPEFVLDAIIYDCTRMNQ